MGRSSDPEMHDQLVRWVAELQPASERWWNLWWLIDSARPFVDERARSALARLATCDDPDNSRAAEQALAALDALARTGSTP